MTRSHGFARITLGGARWPLPWIAVLFVSATLAYAMSSAVHGGTSASDQQTDVHAALPTGEAAPAPALEPSTTALSATSAKPDASLGTEPCWVSVGDPRYARVDMDSSIVAEARRAVCGHAALISSRSDVQHPVNRPDQP
jgi:hypothetical protein